MDGLTTLAALAISLLISYFIIKGAVLEAMKEHTRWSIKNRAELESKYGTPPAP